MMRHVRHHRRSLYRLLTFIVFTCSCFNVYVICSFIHAGGFTRKVDLYASFYREPGGLVQKTPHVSPNVTVMEYNRTNDHVVIRFANKSIFVRTNVLNKAKVSAKDSFGGQKAKMKKPIKCSDTPMTERRRYIRGLRSFVNPHNVTVTLPADQVCTGESPPYLLIVCLSLSSHFEMREAIRTTWASAAKINSATGTAKDKVELVFVVGQADSPRNHTLLTEESDKYGDILQGDFLEEYRLITRKVLMGLKWMVDNCRQASYLMKVDEDVFVNLPQVLESLRKRATDRPAIVGYYHATGKVFRVGNWGVSYEQYKFCHYLPYVEGNSYVMSGRLVAPLFNMSRYHPYMATEDAYITGILREMIGAPIRNERGFATPAKKIKTRNKETLKRFYMFKMLSETRCTAKDMRDLWSVYNDVYKPKSRS